MTPQPLISVIVPIYNVEKYLDNCVKSIVNQTYKNLEIILVDDGSPDNCPAICDNWAKIDSRINVIHQKNSGVSAARNIGIKSSSGDFITFVDGDDFIDSDMYETLVSAYLKNGADIVGCSFRTIDENNDDTVYEKSCADDIVGVSPSKKIIAAFFSENDGNLVSFCNKIIKKSAFDGIEFPVGRIFEDWTLAPIVYDKCNTVEFINCIKYNYIIRKGSAMRTYTLSRYYDCVCADYDHFDYFSAKTDAYNKNIEAFIWSDFAKCVKSYKPTAQNKKMLKSAYKKAKAVCKSNGGTIFSNRAYLRGSGLYHLRAAVPLVYKIVRGEK